MSIRADIPPHAAKAKDCVQIVGEGNSGLDSSSASHVASKQIKDRPLKVRVSRVLECTVERRPVTRFADSYPWAKRAHA